MDVKQATAKPTFLKREKPKKSSSQPHRIQVANFLADTTVF
jgi:hypothetical protein